MPVDIQFPQFGDPKAEEQIRSSVHEAFKALPDEWRVTIEASPADPDWNMTVRGPNHFDMELTLSGEAEHTAEFIVTVIRHTIVGEMSG